LIRYGYTIANVRRPYRSAVRTEAARRTRTAILGSAHEMFVARGYAGTSLRAIAEAASVSVPTVEQAFGTKAALLKAVVDVARAGDDEPVPVLERAPARAALAAGDVNGFVTAITAEIGAVAARVSGIFAVLEQAAATDAQIARLARDVDGQRRTVAAWIVEALGQRARLRLTTEEAVDTIWVLLDPTVHRRLTHSRGWSTSRFVAWLADAMTRLVVAD